MESLGLVLLGGAIFLFLRPNLQRKIGLSKEHLAHHFWAHRHSWLYGG